MAFSGIRLKKALSDKDIMKCHGDASTGSLEKKQYNELFLRIVSDLVIDKVPNPERFDAYNARIKEQAETTKAEAKKKAQSK